LIKVISEVPIVAKLMPLRETSTKAKTSSFGIQVLDSRPDQEAVVVIVIRDDSIIQFVADLSEKYIGGFREFLPDRVSRSLTWIRGDGHVEFPMFEKCCDASAPHWIIFITNEGWKDGELVFEAYFAGHVVVVPALFVDLRKPGKMSSSETVNLKEFKELREFLD
jgi:hypothetical protein